MGGFLPSFPDLADGACTTRTAVFAATVRNQIHCVPEKFRRKPEQRRALTDTTGIAVI